jgi:uncharacterized membrane protein (TIGR02234 family)
VPDAVPTGSLSAGGSRLTARRTFWPSVLLGVAGAGLAAYAGHCHWIAADISNPFDSVQQTGIDSPATTALALVALAAWGVVLVTRRWVRRGVAVLGGLAAVAVIPTIFTTRHDLLARHGGAHTNAWPWIALVGALVSAALAVVAVLKAPQWPEMGAKYDAPTGAAAKQSTSQLPLEEQSSLDLWKSLDEGQDPTRDQD